MLVQNLQVTQSIHLHQQRKPVFLNGQSPHLNPAENLWRDLRWAVHRKRPRSLKDRECFLHERMEKTAKSRCGTLVESSSKRIKSNAASVHCQFRGVQTYATWILKVVCWFSFSFLFVSWKRFLIAFHFICTPCHFTFKVLLHKNLLATGSLRWWGRDWCGRCWEWKWGLVSCRYLALSDGVKAGWTCHAADYGQEPI